MGGPGVSVRSVGQPDREALGTEQGAVLQLPLREPAGAGRGIPGQSVEEQG